MWTGGAAIGSCGRFPSGWLVRPDGPADRDDRVTQAAGAFTSRSKRRRKACRARQCRDHGMRIRPGRAAPAAAPAWNVPARARPRTTDPAEGAFAHPIADVAIMKRTIGSRNGFVPRIREAVGGAPASLMRRWQDRRTGVLPTLFVHGSSTARSERSRRASGRLHSAAIRPTRLATDGPRTVVESSANAVRPPGHHSPPAPVPGPSPPAPDLLADEPDHP